MRFSFFFSSALIYLVLNNARNPATSLSNIKKQIILTESSQEEILYRSSVSDYEIFFYLTNLLYAHVN
jgi:hypothetical protein